MTSLKSIITISLFVLSIGFIDVHAQDKTRETQRVMLNKNHKRTHTPRMPSNQCLEFYYFNDTQECRFTFNYDIESLSVTMTEINTGIAYYGEVSLESPTMYQALTSGCYHITCITDEGDIFEGEGNIQ